MAGEQEQYWIRQAVDRVQGPFAKERVLGWISHGRVRVDMEFSTDGRTWLPGHQVHELFPGATVVVPALAPAQAAVPVPIAPTRSAVPDAAPSRAGVDRSPRRLRGRSRGEGDDRARTRYAPRPASRTGPVVAAVLLVLAAIALVYMFTSTSEAEDLYSRTLSVFEELNQILVGVTDDASAERAQPQLDALSKKMQAIKSDARGVTVTGKEKASLERKFAERKTRIMETLRAHMERLSEQPQVAMAVALSVLSLKGALEGDGSPFGASGN